MSARQHEQPIRIVRKRKKGHGGHHGGAWKVAFADFTTSMMALFLVLWLVTQSSDVRAAIAGYFQDPLGRASEFGNSVVPGTGAHPPTIQRVNEQDLLNVRRQKLRELGERIEARLEVSPELAGLAEHIAIEETPDGLRIQLLEDSSGVFFESGSALPSAHGRTLLLMLGAELTRVPNAMVIEGHTDARPYVSRTGYSNWDLSAERALMARRILSDGGLPDNQVRQVRGFADRALRDPTDPTGPTNRRVTIEVLLPQDAERAGADSSSVRDGTP